MHSLPDFHEAFCCRPLLIGLDQPSPSVSVGVEFRLRGEELYRCSSNGRDVFANEPGTLGVERVILLVEPVGQHKARSIVVGMILHCIE